MKTKNNLFLIIILISIVFLIGCDTDEDLSYYRIRTDVDGQGSIVLDPDKSEYQAQEEIEVEAIPASNWQFEEWEIGFLSGFQNPQTIIIEEDIFIRARFTEERPPTIQPEEDIVGEGTQQEPYIIYTFSGLEMVGNREQGYSLTAYYKLGNNIDASATQNSNYNKGQGWKPIGSERNMFTGVFDGNGYEINDLHIKQTSNTYSGLFGYSRGYIKQLSLKNINITGNAYSVGGVVAINFQGTVRDSYVSGQIEGEQRVGGLVGENYLGIIEDSHTSVNVKGNNEVGGLVAYNNESTIKNSHTTGYVEGNNGVGGLVALNNYGIIENSYASGDINGYDKVGGLIGYGSGIIKASYAEGNVKGNNKVGGLVGFNDHKEIIEETYATGNVEGDNKVGGLIGYNNKHRMLEESYAIGDVEGIQRVGGLIGYNQGLIRKSYADGDVSGDIYIGGLVGSNWYSSGSRESSGAIKNSYAIANVKGDDGVGGLVGSNNGKIERSYAASSVDGGQRTGGLLGLNWSGIIENSYWDEDVSNQSDSDGGEAKISSEMQAELTYTNWDFVDIWTIDDGNDYPRLGWE